MTLIFQNPEDIQGEYLLEKLLEVAEHAAGGGGVFAWATASGVRLLFDDATWQAYMARGPFELVIGVDAVTDLAALDALIEAARRFPNLAVRVFLHDRTQSLFHPKYMWFRKTGGAVVVTGSGNLTRGGLRGNWEAFAITALDQAEADAFEEKWRKWLLANDDRLLAPDDERVRARAARNVGWEAGIRPAPGRVPVAPPPEPDQELEATAPVLVAEIPKAGTRWSQANFDLANYEGFFGARVGTQRRVLLQHVSASGVREEVESRPSVEVRSQNYRFELKAAAGLAYPPEAPPIAVFVRQPDGIFLYRLLMPSDPHYGRVSAFLDAAWTGRADRMRRVRTDVQTLRAAWPDSPLWQG